MGARRGAVGPCCRSALPLLQANFVLASLHLIPSAPRQTWSRHAKRHTRIAPLHSTRLGRQRTPLGLGDSGGLEAHGCGWRGAAGLNLRPVADILFRFRARDPVGLGSPTAARPCLYHEGRCRPCKYDAAAVLPRESLLPNDQLGAVCLISSNSPHARTHAFPRLGLDLVCLPLPPCTWATESRMGYICEWRWTCDGKLGFLPCGHSSMRSRGVAVEGTLPAKPTLATQTAATVNFMHFDPSSMSLNFTNRLKPCTTEIVHRQYNVIFVPRPSIPAITQVTTTSQTKTRWQWARHGACLEALPTNRLPLHFLNHSGHIDPPRANWQSWGQAMRWSLASGQGEGFRESRS